MSWVGLIFQPAPVTPHPSPPMVHFRAFVSVEVPAPETTSNVEALPTPQPNGEPISAGEAFPLK